MGHNIDKLNIQKGRIKKIFISMLETNMNIMEFQLTLTDKKDEKKGIKKIINSSKKSIKVVQELNHYEILVSLYNSFVNGKESYYVLLNAVIGGKQTKYWDTSEKGFQEFLITESDAKAKTRAEVEENYKQKKTIADAIANGKKIEMVYDDGKLKPIIIENA